ncbi:tetratricopeptide repeat protein [Sphingomonas quercus]|uniref:Tetratricopeptide repeat protein n=1 Tax=Sphingomonas quercus TaxID=2842451 RepID=A0ABS6BHE3_9SPHN|nr:hypothetical protein [Sphingomonas quercus]
MTTLILAAMLAAQPAPAAVPPSDNAARFEACAKLAGTDPAAAEKQADAWRLANGGIPARQCLGLAYVGLERYGPAAAAFTQAAKDAEIQHDGRAAILWVLAGNASLAGGDATVARTALSRALALDMLIPAQAGEAYLDRARAAVAANDPAAARADIDAALKLVAADPMAWLLSATLARRQGQYERAAKDILEADRLAPGNAAIAYEDGNIAMASGKPDAARAAWARAAASKGDPAAERAAAALEANPAR